MKSKHLLLMLLLALMAPWAAMGQTPLTGENFNSMTSLATSYSATDWYAYNAGSGNNWTLNTSSGVSSSKCVQYKWNSSYAANCYLVSTPFDVNAQMEELSVSLYEKTASSSYPETFEVFFVKASDVTDDASITSATKYMVIASASYTNTSYAERTGSNDNSALAGQSVRLVIHCTSAKDQHTLFIDDITITETIASSCSKPDTFEHSNVTHNSATLTWSGGSDTYNVEVKGGEWADWTEILHETTLTTKNLENLTMSTNYEARVQSVCTGENSLWKSTSFSTECGPVGIGYKCGFEGPNTGGTTSYPLPACWTRTGTSTNYPYAYNSGSHLGSYCLYFSGTSSTNASAMLPVIEGGINGKRLSFYLKVSNMAVSMSVGYLNGTNTFVEVESVAPTTTYSYQLMEVDFANIEGNPTNMVLKFKSTYDYTAYAYIDDVELQETPPCTDMQVQASTITATATAYNAATVTWTGAGAATQWKVQCSQDNTFATVDKEVVANTTTANITDLTAETTYYVRVAPYCTENSEYNPWSSNKSFSTPESCPASVLAAATNPTAHGATLNWTGTSDHYDVMYRTAAYTDGLVEEFGSSSTPTGWTNGSGSLNTETGTATITSGSNWSFGTNCGVFDSHAYFNMYSTKNYWLITPQIAIGTDYPFSFKVAYTKYSSGSTNTAPTADGPHKLYVLISIDEKAHWTVLREYNNSGSAYVLDDISKTGQTVNDISLAAYAGKKAYIAFYGVSSTTDYDNNIHIDNVTVGPGTSHEAGTWANAVTDITASTVVLDDDNKFDPETIYDVKLVGYCPWTNKQTESNTVQFTTSSSCETPSNLQESEVTTNSAKITWNTHGLTNFNLRYSSDGGSSWTTVENVSSPYTFPDNLTANKEYQVQAQGICTAGTTEWSVALVFWTECDAFTVDMQHSFTQFFDESTFPRCWDNPIEVINSYNRQWTRASLNHTATSGSGSAYSGYYGPIYLMMPDLAIANGTTDVKLNFWARLDYSNTYDGTTAKSSVVLIDGNTETELWTYDDVANITDLEDLWKDYSINLSAYKGQTISLAFKYEGNDDHGWYIDDVEVAFDPTCFPVSNLSYSDVTNHSATITWNKGTVGQDTWQVKYNRDADFDPDTEGTTIPEGDYWDTTYTFDKTLYATSHYYVYVRANCGDVDGPSTWVKTDFTTLEIAPAPSAFTASNFASTKVDLVWTAGGGDFEDSWDLYYVASATAPEEPTATTEATKTVTTLPTALAPYELTGLTAETRYYIWVRANHGSDKSAWVALTGDYFETTAACSALDPVVSDITHHNATVTWNGESASGFTVNYRTAAGIDGSATPALSEKFDNSSLPTGWGRSSTALSDAVLNGTTTINSITYGWSSSTYGLGQYNWKMNIYNTSKYWLITPSTTIGTNNILNFDAAITEYGADAAPDSDDMPDAYSRFVVLITTDDQATWTILREWNNTGSADVLNNISNTGNNFSIDLSAYAGETVKIAFYGGQTQSGPDSDLHIDNVIVTAAVPAGAWQTQAATTTTANLTGLTAGTNYDLKVVPDCDATQESATVQFTTLDGNTKYFLTEGAWNTAANWMDEEMPAITDNAILRANATITGDAAAKKITMEGATTPILTIADGGTLQTDNTVTATVKKNITGYGDAGVGTNNGYYLIANPINTSIGNATTYGMATSDGLYDLYQFNANPGASDSLEWRNYKANSFYIANGKGYLYANKNDVELTFTGTVRANNAAAGFGATFAGNWQFKGWNLFGNPFVCDAYLVDAETGGSALPYYKMNSAGNNVESVSGGAIAPMEGIFYEASAATNVYFTRTNPAVTSTGPKGNLNILVSNTNTRGSSVIDNAIISFSNPNTLGKLNLFACDARVFIPQDGKDYAVAYAESNVGEMPLNFKAEKNGAYTLSFTAEEVGFSYLHLIDNMTGADIDLLAGASTGSATYTFNAKMTDYATRFRLVFATGSSVEGDNFGFINGSGNLCIFGIEGTATLQVIDVTGRILSSETFSGSYEKHLNATPGVYVMRLINGNEVKTQKIVVR